MVIQLKKAILHKHLNSNMIILKEAGIKASEVIKQIFKFQYDNT